MRLNTCIIAEELGNLVSESHSATSPLVFDCILPRPYFGGSFSGGFLYVSRADDLPESPVVRDKKVSLVCIGSAPQAYVTTAFDLIVVSGDASFSEVFNKVVGIFERYEAWGASLQEVIDKRLPPAELGKRSFGIVGNPLFVLTSSYMCLFHVVGPLGTLSEDQRRRYREDYGGAVPLAANHYLPLSEIKRLNMSDEFVEARASLTPGIYPGEAFGIRSLYLNLGPVGKPLARILIDELYKPLTKRDMAIITILGHYVELAIPPDSFNPAGATKLFADTVSDLLARRFLEERSIVEALAEMGWQMHDTYVCTAIDFAGNGHHGDALRTVGMKLFNGLEKEYFTVHEGQLFFIHNLTLDQETVGDFAAKWGDVLEANGLRAGMGVTFSDFKNLYYFCRQARRALELAQRSGATKQFSRYDDYVLDDMAARCKGGLIPESFAPTGLVTLYRHDLENGTHHVDTLRTYLRCNSNVSRTARELFVHRNTCIYHLEQIRKISGLDLDDHRTRLGLSLYFELL